MSVELKDYETQEFIQKADRVELSDFMVIYRKWCKSCGICIEFCPTKCLKFDEDLKPIFTDVSKCTRCRLCDLMCPDLALLVIGKEKKENK